MIIRKSCNNSVFPKGFNIASCGQPRSCDEGYVKLAPQNGGYMFNGRGLDDLEGDSWILGYPNAKETVDEAGRDRRNDTKPQAPLASIASSANVVQSALELGEDRSNIISEALAGVRQSGASAMALEERYTKALFKIANPTADDGLPYIEARRRPAEATSLSHLDEVLKITKFHPTLRRFGEIPVSKCHGHRAFPNG